MRNLKGAFLITLWLLLLSTALWGMEEGNDDKKSSSASTSISSSQSQKRPRENENLTPPKGSSPPKKLKTGSASPQNPSSPLGHTSPTHKSYTSEEKPQERMEEKGEGLNVEDEYEEFNFESIEETPKSFASTTTTTSSLPTVPELPFIIAGQKATLKKTSKKRGIWRQNLDYEYEGKVFSTHKWHVKVAGDVKKIADNPKFKSETIDFAKARIEAIFRLSGEGKKNLIRKTYEFPSIFSSRSHLAPEGGTLNFTSFSELFRGTEEEKKKFLEDLLGRTVIKNENYQKDYYHAEMAILCATLNVKEWKNKIFSDNSQESGELTYLILTMCSYYDPCSLCSRALYRAGSVKKFFVDEMRKRVGCQNLEGVFINVSSLTPYQGSRGCLKERRSRLYANTIKLPSPFFAQMMLEISSEEPEHLPEYVSTYKIATGGSTKTDEKELQQALAKKNWEDAGELYFKLIYNGYQPIPEEFKTKFPQLIGKLKSSPNDDAEKVSARKDIFVTQFVQHKEREKEDKPLDRNSILTTLTNSLKPYISHLSDRNIDLLFQKDLEERDAKRSTANKAQRDMILGKYLNPAKCDPSGTRISEEVEVYNMTYLLKIFGFIYLGDFINPTTFPIPEHLKNLKKKRSKPSSKTNSNKNILQKLKEMADQNTDHFLGPIAQFFYDEITRGMFEPAEKGKYHWVRKK